MREALGPENSPIRSVVTMERSATGLTVSELIGVFCGIEEAVNGGENHYCESIRR